MNIGSRYRQSPVVPAVPFIHNSMVTYGISRMWHPPSSRQVKRHWQHPFTWRARSVTTPVCLSCFLFITNVNLNAFTLEMVTTLILCSKAPISSNTIRVKSFPWPDKVLLLFYQVSHNAWLVHGPCNIHIAGKSIRRILTPTQVCYNHRFSGHS